MRSFEQAMAFYTAYHQEPRNVMLHVLGVPVILYALMVPLSWVGPLHPGTVPVNLAMALAAGVLVYYLMLDHVFAMAAAVLFGLLLWAAAVTAAQGALVGWSVFLTGQALGWSAQIIGHHYYEGRKPALIDNLLQALVSAPIFIIADVFFFFGFRRDKAEALHAAVAERGQLREG